MSVQSAAGRIRLPALPQTPVEQGIFFAVVAVVIFAAQDGISKHLASEYPPIWIVTVRYWAFAIFVLALSSRRPGGVRAVARSGRPWLQIARGALLAFQVVLAITAFARFGLAHTHSIMAAAPLLVAALSVPVLGEPVGWRRWLAITAGFCGILMILRPGMVELDHNVFWAIGGGIGIAIYGLLTRLAGRYDRAETSFFYTGVAGAAAITLVGVWQATMLTPTDWAWMGLLCVTGMAGHYFLIRAFELASAVVVQPITYLQLVMVSVIGVVLFGESVDGWTAAGATVVVAAGLFNAWRERLARKRAAAAAG